MIAIIYKRPETFCLIFFSFVPVNHHVQLERILLCAVSATCVSRRQDIPDRRPFLLRSCCRGLDLYNLDKQNLLSPKIWGTISDAFQLHPAEIPMTDEFKCPLSYELPTQVPIN